MEPKRSMSVFAAVVVLAIALLAMADFATAAVWTSIGLAVLAGLCFAESRRLLARGGRADRTVPSHRARLDKIVLGQWVGASVLGAAAGLACMTYDFAPLAETNRFVDTLIVGVTVGAISVFFSSLIDWYVILPKISGLAGPAPCECAGGSHWKYTTSIWYFHRAAATALIYLAATGVPSYMGGTAKGSGIVAWGIVAVIVATAGGYFFRAMFLAGWYAFNPPILVGDQIFVNVAEEGDGDVAVRRHRAYVLDVSLQGAKYKILHEGRYAGKSFVDKDDGNVPNHKLPEVKAPRKDSEPLCGKDHCTGVNWYCRFNAKAHD
jgi:hypothetical protein